MSSEAVDYDGQVASVREAFEREFERFARFQGGAGTEGLSLEAAEAHLRELGELRTRHTAKKSALAQLMKLIGRGPAEERAALGQRVQALNGAVVEKLDEAQAALNGRIGRLKVERERVDVTLPGRRPRRGHLH